MSSRVCELHAEAILLMAWVTNNTNFVSQILICSTIQLIGKEIRKVLLLHTLLSAMSMTFCVHPIMLTVSCSDSMITFL